MAKGRMLMAGVVAGIMALAFQSCSKTPIACFSTTPAMDSIHVNTPVVFDARCSVYAGSYNWQFYNNVDSIAFTPTVTKTFKDTGTVEVYLLVTWGNQYAGLTQNITVQP
jgi:hypothetical protein